MNMEVYELWQIETPYRGDKIIIALKPSEVNRNPSGSLNF